MVAGKRLRVASLFSGCGGMDLGLQMARFGDHLFL
jgi:site-specific DNA-cytosine methylase